MLAFIIFILFLFFVFNAVASVGKNLWITIGLVFLAILILGLVVFVFGYFKGDNDVSSSDFHVTGYRSGYQLRISGFGEETNNDVNYYDRVTDIKIEINTGYWKWGGTKFYYSIPILDKPYPVGHWVCIEFAEFKSKDGTKFDPKKWNVEKNAFKVTIYCNTPTGPKVWHSHLSDVCMY